MDLGGLLEGFLGPFWEALGVPLGGLWASWGSSWSSLGPLGRHWGSSWRSLGPLGHHFGGPGALLGSILELSGAPWGHFGGNLCIFVWIWQFSCINAVFFKSILGKSINVLFENKLKNQNRYFGRDEYSNSVIVEDNSNLVGKIISVEINDFNHNTLFGKLKIKNKTLAA